MKKIYQKPISNHIELKSQTMLASSEHNDTKEQLKHGAQHLIHHLLSH